MPFFRTSTIISIAIIFISVGCANTPKQNDTEALSKPTVSNPQKVPVTQEDVTPQKDMNPGGLHFSAGIACYEDGKYALAEKKLKEALDLGLADVGDNVTAHKYLAFLFCVSSRTTLCRKEFKKAFELDPDFTLSPAEEGHPMWQKTYRQVKSQMNPSKKTP